MIIFMIMIPNLSMIIFMIMIIFQSSRRDITVANSEMLRQLQVSVQEIQDDISAIKTSAFRTENVVYSKLAKILQVFDSKVMDFTSSQTAVRFSSPAETLEDLDALLQTNGLVRLKNMVVMSSNNNMVIIICYGNNMIVMSSTLPPILLQYLFQFFPFHP